MRQTRRSEEHYEVTSDISDVEELAGTSGSFLRNVWYVAGWATEFEGAAPVGRTILDDPVVLYRTKTGKLVALEDRCAHRWAPLSLGRVEGEDLRCMYHGLRFGVDGHCVEVPGQDAVPRSLCVRSYPVIERHRFAWIWMGDPALMDPSLIPDLGMLDEPWRRLYVGSLDFEANYTLINANLLDLSHTSFLHEKTLGRPVASSSESYPKPQIPSGSGARPLDRGVGVTCWLSGSLARTVLLPKNVPDGDLWSKLEFLVPGIYIGRGQMHPSGTAEQCKGLAPEADRVPYSDTMSIQAVTPLSSRKSRYFFSLGPRASDMDKEESDAVWATIMEAFSEDLQMIQAQQRLIDAHPGRRMGMIAVDRGPVLFERLMSRLIAAEKSAGVR